MAARQKTHSLLRRRAWLTVRVWSAIFGVAIITLDPAALKAQQPASSAVYVAGNAAVTGFSGALPPVQIAPGDDPDQKTFIDTNGPSLRVVDLQHMGGPPQAQLVAAPKPFTFTAAQLGQVFGVVLDDGMPANIFAAASSAYGLRVGTRRPAAAHQDRRAQPANDPSAAVASNAAELFSSAHQVTLGNPQGDVTLVEFFDYNCGFCKRALPDTLALLKDDPKLRIVLKEFPILGPARPTRRASRSRCA